jgi:hypothetical protein
MRKKLSLQSFKRRLPINKLRNAMALLLLLISINASAVVVTIPSDNANGTGGTAAQMRQPYATYFGYGRSAFIYQPTEIGTSGIVSTIGFYINSVAATPGAAPVQIYLKHTASATFAASTTVATELTGATLVYSGTISTFTANSWLTVTLSPTFSYDGTSNLEIIVLSSFTGGGSGEGTAGKVFRYTSQGTGNNRMQYWETDTNPPTGTGTRSIYRQNVQLTVTPPPCSGVPAAAAATTTTSSFACSGAPILGASTFTTGSNISYQWETSLAGQNIWSDVGGTLTGSPAFTAPVIAASRDYRLKTTCPTFGTTPSNIVTVSVNTTVNAGTATTATPSIVCTGGAILDATGITTGNGMQYQWQFSPAGQGVWNNVGIAGSSAAYIAPAITANTDYRVVSTCGPAFVTNVSAAVPVTVQSINITPATSTICATNSQPLQVTLPGSLTLFKADFENGSNGGFTFTNTSTGATPAGADWTIRPNNYVMTATAGPYTWSPGSAFIVSNADATGTGGAVNTTMTTPVINAAGATTLNLSFKHHMKFLSPTSCKVEVFNGTAWIEIANFNSANVGTLTTFASESYNIAAHANANMRVRFSFVGGWVWWWALDDVLVTGIVPNTIAWTATTGGGLPAGAGTASLTNNNISVTPTGVGTYTYTATSSGCGTKTATVTVVPAPAATITVGAPICAGQTGTFNFAGVAGNIVYFHEGSSTTVNSVTLNGSGTGSFTTAALAGNLVVTVDSVKNLTCTVLSSLTATQVVNPRPQGTFVGTSTVCKNAPVAIAFNTSAVNFPIDVTFSDGTTTFNETVNGSANFTVPSNVVGTQVYQITGLTDVNNCAGISGTDFSGTATVNVNELPSATISSASPGVCDGDNTDVTITFNGPAPFTFGFFDGNNNADSLNYNSNTHTFTVTPTAASTDYYLNYLVDGNTCSAIPTDIDDIATVIIWDTAKITAQPQATITACSQNNAIISMTATGYNLTYIWYENGVAISALNPNYTAAGNTLTINNVSGLSGNSYYVEVQGQCGNVQTSATTTLTENLNNNWSGTVSSDWDNGMNWSCGTVPIVTTNVLIPAGVPNMPMVNVNNAVCDNLTIAATASVTFTGVNNKLSVHGDITNNGGLDGTGGTVELAGASQGISGAATFSNLEVTGGGVKTLGGNTVVGGILNLNNGWIELGSNSLILSQPTAQLGGSPASYIVTNGTGSVSAANMGVGGNPDAVTFHVGIDNTSYTPIMLENLGTADGFQVRVVQDVYADGVGTDPTLVTNPVINRTWMVSESITGGSIVNMTPMWNSPSNEINGFVQAHVFVAHYWNNEWISYVDSANGAPIAVAGPFPGMWMTTQDSIENFSPFTVASSGQFPLAIRLNSILATNVGPRNKVQWTSSTEDKGDMYELESSADGRTFAKIATVAANGKASTYTQWDETPVQGVNYYRVKMLDAAGKFSYSKVVMATVKGVDGFNIEAYPNPVSSTVSIKVNGVVTGKANVTITDITGKLVKEKIQVVDNNASIDVSNLASGAYMINYSDDSRNESIKITKQ